MEIHFTVPEVKAVISAMERELKNAKVYQLDTIEVLDLEDLKARFERKLHEHETKQKQKTINED